MRILQINSVCGVTGTGHIVADLYEAAVDRGHECRIAYGEHKYNNRSGDMQVMEIGTLQDCRTHALLTRLWDRQGFGSYRATKQFLKKVEEYRPDVIHLHNLHGYYIHVGLLFSYLKKRKVRVVWTLHDCWAFTGHCVHFLEAGCEKWQEQCGNCPLTRQYPASLWYDGSAWNYKRKKELFTGIEDMTLLVPSKWLEEKVRRSFLHDYPIEVVYNGIDLDKFHPIPSDFREKYSLQKEFVVLGVANVWTERKGLATFLELSKKLGSGYRIVLVGLSQGQLEQLPGEIIGLPRTDTVEELAAIYTAADVFVNPGREETFGLTVAEAAACGTLPIVYAGTACAEVAEQSIGRIVTGGTEALAAAIRSCREEGLPAETASYAQCFSRELFGRRVMEIYER